MLITNSDFKTQLPIIMNKVDCIDCLGNIPDTVNPKGGMSRCKAYEHYVNKGANKAQLNDLLVELGNARDYHLFWPGKRVCTKFKVIPI